MIPHHHSVMVGFCNGLGLAGLAQFNILKVLVAMQDDDAAERAWVAVPFTVVARLRPYKGTPVGGN
jgi:hypothetical protein